MSEIRHIFRCYSCDRTAEFTSMGPVPICCDKPMIMEELDVCTSAAHAEMARNEDEDAPCDDGRGKRIDSQSPTV